MRSWFNFMSSVLVLTLASVLALALPSFDVFALDSPPACKDALWSGNPWGTVNADRKVVNENDTVTLTATIIGGPPAGYYCGWGEWNEQGTSGVTIQVPECFELVDYSPKADTWHTVAFGAHTAVAWGAVEDPLPGQWINELCYCRSGVFVSYKDCPRPKGKYGPGDSFKATFRATCNRVDVDWSRLSASFGGNWGPWWSDYAEDYYKFGGQMGVQLTADPTVVPADGSVSTLSALVLETTSDVHLPGQMVDFGSLIGIINPTSALTDENGIARASFSSPGFEGVTMASASVPDAMDTAQVEFTHVDNPPTGPEVEFGKLKAQLLVGDPVHAGIGNFIFSKLLFSFPGKGLPVAFEVSYNSLDGASDGSLGFGWTHTYNVVLTASEPDVTIRWGDGHRDSFRNDGTGAYMPLGGKTSVSLAKPDTEHWDATLANKVKYRFDAAGKLLSIIDLNGNQITLTHSTHLDRITDTAGRRIDFTYSGGRLAAITSPMKAGDTASFDINGNGDLIGITDARGKTWRFTYDTAHRVVTHMDAKNVTVLTNTYDGSGRIVQQMDGAGHITTFEATSDATGTRVMVTPTSGNAVWHYYDRAHNLTKVIDGEGNEANFDSDSRGRLVAAADKKGAMAQVSYDAPGNPTNTRDRTGAEAQFGYNAQNRPTSVTDALGNETSLGYDTKGNLTHLRNPLGSYGSLVVDAAGLTTSVTDFRGRQWRLGYDSSGLPQSVTDPHGAQTGYTHDTAGRLTRVSLPVPGVTAQMSYNEAGDLESLTDPLGHVTTFTYDDNGNLATRTFVPTGATTSYSYDWGGRPVKITDALGGETTTTYDADDNLKTVTDPDGVVITYEHDKANRVTAVLDPLGHRVRYTYDANGSVTSVSNEIGDTWKTGYDAEGRPVVSTDPAGGAIHTAHDAIGRIISTTDELGHSESFQYDKADRLVATTLPDGGVVKYDYDENGRVLGITDPLGHSWSFAYDRAGRLDAKTDPTGKTESLGLDTMDRLTSRTLRDGTVIGYAYDAGSRLTSVTLPGPTIISYGYDEAGNVTSVTDPSGVTTMTYDLLGRRLSRTDPNGATIGFTYTAAGRLQTMTYPGNNVVTYAYDIVGRLSTITDWRSNVTTFHYDSVDRVTRVDLPNGTRTLYTYDEVGRVATRISRKGDNTVLASYAYSYDGTGRITSVDRTEPATPTFVDSEISHSYDPVNRVMTTLVDGVSTAYTFDLKGNLTSKVTGGQTTSYAYDALNRLVSVSDGTNTTTYTYDGAGNRTAKTFNGAATRYVREGGSVYCTLNGTGTVTGYNIHAGSLLYSLSDSGAVTVYHGDERGSVVAVTNQAQNVVRSYAYDPYGKVVGGSGSLSSPFRFVGLHGVLADENGLYHMQARYYDPAAHRFINEDPIGLEGGMNLYAYVAGDPVNAIDPEGLQGWQVWPHVYEYPQFGSREEMMAWVESLKQKYAKEIAAKEAQHEAYKAWYYGTEEGKNLQKLQAIRNNTSSKLKLGKYTNPTNAWDLKINHTSATTVEPGGWRVSKSTVTNYKTPWQKISGAGGKSFWQRWGTRIKGGVSGIGARIAMEKTIVSATISYASTTSVGEVIAVHGVGGVAAPVVGSAVAGWFVGREIGKAKLSWDPIKGEYVSVDQGLIDVMKPGFEKSYRTYDPNLDATQSIREWCRQQGFEYSDALNKKPGSS